MSEVVRVFTLWFLTVGTAFFASLDIYCIANGINVGTHLVFLSITFIFQILVIRTWGQPKPKPGKPKSDGNDKDPPVDPPEPPAVA